MLYFRPCARKIGRPRRNADILQTNHVKMPHLTKRGALKILCEQGEYEVSTKDYSHIINIQVTFSHSACENTSGEKEAYMF